jgi:hypothetical protein
MFAKHKILKAINYPAPNDLTATIVSIKKLLIATMKNKSLK